jgi:hypothetical protein
MVHTLYYKDRMFLQDRERVGPEGTFYPYSKGYVPYRFTQATLSLS